MFSNFADDNSNQTESAAGTSDTSFERERRPYTASTQTKPAAENINRTSNSKLNQNQESIPTTKTANEPTANHNSLPENNNDGFEGVFTIDEDIPINSQNRADSSSRDNRDKRPIVPDIIISNDPDLDQPHSPPIEIPIREHRPYSYSSSAPAEMMETVNLMSIMAQNIPLESLSTKTLRLILLQERVSTAHILEKQDLIAKVQTLIKNIRGEIANQNNDEMLCRICVDNVINCVLLECGHYTLCLECAETIKRSTKECPICRQTITRIVHTFKS